MLQACFRKFLIVQKTSFCRSVMLKKGGIACQAESICRKTSRLPLGAPAAYFPEFVSSELLKQAEFPLKYHCGGKRVDPVSVSNGLECRFPFVTRDMETGQCLTANRY